MADAEQQIGPGELVCITVDNANAFAPLAAAAELVDAAVPRLRRLGFATQGTDLLGDGQAAQVLRRLEDWEPDHRRPLLLYWTGHGVLRSEGELFLICRDSPSEPGAETSAVIRGSTLGALLAAKQVPQVILFLDACHSGGGVGEVVKGYLQKRDRLRKDAAKRMSLAVISTAQKDERAREGAFADALIRFVDGPCEGSAELERSERLSIGQFAAALQQILDGTDGNIQTLERQSCGLREPMLDNPHYKPHLLDFPAQLRAGRDAAIDGSLAEHFMLKFRGIEVLGDRGWYFSGRRRTLEKIAGWLAEPNPGLFVLTGPPGCGKSAVLGRLAVLSDPRARRLAEQAGALGGPLGPGAEANILDVGLHIRGLTLAECVAGIASGLGVEAADARTLCRQVADRAQATGRAQVVMVDALDEAKPADRLAIAADLLRPLAEVGRAKVLVGVRPQTPAEADGVAPVFGVLEQWARHIWRLNQDDPDGESDIADYIERRLLDHDSSPYVRRDRPDAAHDAARLLARRAGGIFLLARAFCQVLVHQEVIPDLESADNRELFSTDVDLVFAADLTRFGPQEQVIRDLLTPLAWAEGKGLPMPLWAAVVDRLRSDRSHPPVRAEGMQPLIEMAAAYLIESSEDGQPVYRLYAEQFARFLRAGADPVEMQTSVTEALVESVQVEGMRVWDTANPYVRRHLPAHAAACGQLRDLVDDPLFLAYADPDGLRAVIGGVDPQRKPYARLYGRVAHRMRTLVPAERLALLQESASRDEPELLPTLALFDLVWRGLGSTSLPTPFHRVLSGSAEAPYLVGILRAQDRSIVASYDGSTVNAWDPVNGERLQTLSRIRATDRVAAFGTLRARRVDETTGVAGTDTEVPVLAYAFAEEVRFLDVLSGAAARPPLPVATAISALEFARVSGRDALAIAGAGIVLLVAVDDGTVLQTLKAGRVRVVASSARGSTALLATADQSGISLWDLLTGEQRDRVPVVRPIHAMALAVTADGPLLAYDDLGASIRLWHAERGETRLSGHEGLVSSLALVSAGSDTLLVSGAADGTSRLWDPAVGRSTLLQDRADAVAAVAAGLIDGRPVLATAAAKDRDVRLWDPAPRPPSAVSGGATLPAIPETTRTVAFTDDTRGPLNPRSPREPGEPGVLVGTDAGTLELRALDGASLRSWRLPGRVASAAARGGYAAAGLVGGRLTVFPLDTEGQPRVFVGHRGVVESLAFLPNGVLASGGADGLVKFWNPVSSTEAIRHLSLDGSGITALSCVASTTGVLLACTTASAATLFGLPGSEPLHRIPQPGPARLSTCALGSIGSTAPKTVLALGDELGGLYLYETEAGTLLRVFEGHTKRVYQVAIGRLSDQDVVASASSDGTVRIWDPGTGACLDMWTEQVQWLRAAAFRFDGDGLLRALAMGKAAHFARADRVPDTLRAPG